MSKQIIAMGGGGFSAEPENLALDHYFLNQSDKKTPRVCFIPTASGDSDNYIRKFYDAYNRLDCVPSHLSLFNAPTADLENYILEQDAIFVGGGNTRNLIALWKEWNLDGILRTAYDTGILLAGMSAGSICWFSQGVTDSIPGRLSSLECLGFLSGSNCPHYDGESQRRPSYHQLMEAGEIVAGIAADDGVALHFIDGQLSVIVTSRPRAKAYNVSVVDGKAVEQELEARLLTGEN